MLQALHKAMWSIALPVFVLGGMYLGVFTATEAAAAGVWLALFVTVLIYCSIGWRALWASAQDACPLSAVLFMILAGATVFCHLLTQIRVQQQILDSFGAMVW